MGFQPGQGQEQTSLTFNWLLLDTIRRMRDAQAEEDIDKFYVYMNTAFLLCVSSYPKEFRKKLNDEFVQFEKDVKQIKKEEQNESSRKRKIRDAKKAFCEQHILYVYHALPKMDIYKVIKEGLIDFNKNDFENVAKALRSSSGIPSLLKKAGFKKEGKDGA